MKTETTLRAAYTEYLKDYYFELKAQEQQLTKDTGQFLAELGQLITDGPYAPEEVRLVA